MHPTEECPSLYVMRGVVEGKLRKGGCNHERRAEKGGGGLPVRCDPRPCGRDTPGAGRSATAPTAEVRAKMGNPPLLQNPADPRHHFALDSALQGEQWEAGIPLSHGAIRPGSKSRLGRGDIPCLDPAEKKNTQEHRGD